ncbi:MAG TPA: S9 family peptidase [Chitinophagaceae bacterium]|nr:S9 family peptidase [Chitinophagaceae bacterium]
MRSILGLMGFLVLVSACNNTASEKEAVSKEVKQYTIEQFYKSSEVFGGVISGDDKKMLVTSNESGIYNVYEIDIASGQKQAITNSDKESIFANSYVPGTTNIIYSSDKGGDEMSHLYLRKTSGELKDLTPGKEEKAQFWGWSKDEKYLYYLSNKRDPRFFDLYKMDTTKWSSQMIYKNGKGFDVSAVSPNERYFALVENLSTSSNNAFLVDQQNGTTRKINADSVEATINPLKFSLDNNTLYYLTNDGSEFTYIMKYDIATGKKDKLYEAGWDVVWMALSNNEKYRVIYVNEDGQNKLHLFDHATGKELDFPAIRDGTIQGVNISKDENKMGITVGSSKAPNNMYVYDFNTRELKKLTNTLNPEIQENDLVAAEVVRYKSFDGLEIPAIYYKPYQASANNKAAAVVFVHGGPGGQAGVYYFSLIQYLVNHGYAVLDVNNRGSSGYGKTFFKMDNRDHGNKDLKDVIWGKKYLASLPYIDSSKIAILGGSYGGYMTVAALCFHPDEFKAGVDLFGVVNWPRTLKEIPAYWDSFRKALYEELGDPNSDDSVRLKQYSPLLHASNIKKPLMVLQGANDPRVQKKESDEVVETVKKNGVPVEYVVFPDEGHGFIKKENEIKGYGHILQFLDKYVKN